MLATLKLSALFLLLVGLSPAANAISFDYRFYNNSGCDHSSPAEDTFPLNGRGALSGSQDQCLSAPTTNNWNALEVDNPINTGGLVLITFCDIDCQGARSSEQSNSNCFHPAPNCFIGSFSVTQAPSESSSSTLPPSNSPINPLPSFSAQPSSSSSTQSTLRSSSTQSASSSSSDDQLSTSSSPMPLTLTVTQTPVGVGSSISTQSFDTSKPKVPTGAVAGGVVGGVIVVAGLVFLLFFLLRRARKRPQVSSDDIPAVATPFSSSHALTATTIDETRSRSLTPITVQTTGKFVRGDRSSGASVVVSRYDDHLSPLNSGPDPYHIRRHEDSGARFARTGGSMVQLPPLYTRG
ncbi:hypothetical protein GALMADRAFT_245782 [Galerina marginata CBS 339.88]|uniref:WSC domain-containing protein n=1 Tax=Galerina marginata (strain CBS 339.88) TaxID=685588 RepID=A0A067T5K7_GALM3|nr:hypothetical protein GALMADRAFT_245782 [Galerina marginata CBS 339.88]